MPTVQLVDYPCVVVRCNDFSDPTCPVMWHDGSGEWAVPEYDSSHCKRTTEGLADVAKYKPEFHLYLEGPEHTEWDRHPKWAITTDTLCYEGE
jgi:hypothetical protein